MEHDESGRVLAGVVPHLRGLGWMSGFRRVPLWILAAASFGFGCGCSLAAEPSGPVVVANGGEWQGSWEGEYGRVAAFKGVPFAAPPVGDLRWRAPKEPIPVSGRRLVTEFAPACLQTGSMTEWYAEVASAFGAGPEVAPEPLSQSEDCLYLNIWTPELKPDAALPVMVYVHGGGNGGGWSYEPNYVGAELAAKGAVVVSIAYRLGPFGFFAHPALDNGADEPSANFALLDIEAAFDWVRAHIAAFGGDPRRVTGFGESAGAFNLVDLLASSLDRPGSPMPFDSLISQSIGGSLTERQTLEQERELGVQLVHAAGLHGEVTARSVRGIPAAALLEASRQLPADHYFDAVIDGKVLQRTPLESFRAADRIAVDLIAGTNADEWYMYVDPHAVPADLQLWLRENALGREDAVLDEIGREMPVRRALDQLRTARNMLCPSRFLADIVNERGGRGWVYYFSRARPSAGGEILGAYHGTELPYVFGTHDDWLPADAGDLALTTRVMQYWLQFARSGDPNLPGQLAWPRYRDEDPSVLRLDEQIQVMEPFSQRLCELLGPAAVAGGKI